MRDKSEMNLETRCRKQHDILLCRKKLESGRSLPILLCLLAYLTRERERERQRSRPQVASAFEKIFKINKVESIQ